jgi:hypothetical protein
MIIFMLLCYLSLFLDAQRTTGVIGYIRNTYSDYFVLFLASYAFASIICLMLWKAPPVGLLLAGFPILAYCIMGLWYTLLDPTAPWAAFFVHLSSVGNVLWLVRMRIRGITHGGLDDTILPDSTDTNGR